MKTTLDFSPLFRSGIGFDRVFDVLDSVSQVQVLDNWPPYDIVKEGDDAYRISMAVAGFDRDELNITQRPNLLVVSGKKTGDDNTQYLHRGIAGRAFERRFELADHVRVADARVENGLLHVFLVREIPEAMKPRRIEIRSADAVTMTHGEPREIEKQKAA
jgi:molecular chaperone IbpA